MLIKWYISEYIVVSLERQDAQNIYNCQIWAPSIKVLAKTLPLKVIKWIAVSTSRNSDRSLDQHQPGKDCDRSLHR